MSTKSRTELERRIAEGTDSITKESVGEYANYDSKWKDYLKSKQYLTETSRFEC